MSKEQREFRSMKSAKAKALAKRKCQIAHDSRRRNRAAVGSTPGAPGPGLASQAPLRRQPEARNAATPMGGLTMAAVERLLTLEQMQVHMLVAGADDPMKAASELQGRWLYILGLARAAQRGLSDLDTSLPQVMLECDDYAQRAELILAALDEWFADHGQPQRVRLGESRRVREEGAW